MKKLVCFFLCAVFIAAPATAATKYFGLTGSDSTPVPVRVVLADFDGDGRVDAIVSDDGTGAGDGAVAIQTGNGDGTFNSPQLIASGGTPDSMVSADLNGDGKPDLIIGDSQTATIQVLLSNGDGTFTQGQALSAGPTERLRIVDFNGDGKPDLVVVPLAQGSGVKLFPGLGDGTFGTPVTISTPDQIADVAVGDLNGDGIPDLVMADYLAETLQVLIATAPGVYAAPVAVATQHFVTLAALTRDPSTGFLDIVAGSQADDAASGFVQVFAGAGDGTFASPVDYGVQGSPEDILVSDISGDGIPDIETVNPNSDLVYVFIGKGDGTYGSTAAYRVGLTPLDFAVADVNGDGLPDLVTTDLNDGAITTLVNRGSGRFATSTEYLLGTPWMSDPIDVDGDGYPDEVDLIQATVSGQRCIYAQTLLNDKHGTLIIGPRSPLGCDIVLGEASGGVQIHDMNGDGIPDLVFLTGKRGADGLGVAYGNGDGTFVTPQIYFEPNPGIQYLQLSIDDFDKDGRPDIAVSDTNGTLDGVAIFTQQPDGSFVEHPQVFLPDGFHLKAIADLNGDGFPDAVLLGVAPTVPVNRLQVQVMLGGAGVSFAAPVVYDVAGVAVSVGDVNNDGFPDLVVSSADGTVGAPNGVAAMLNNGDGTFRPGIVNAMPDTCLHITLADLNNDGKLDVVCVATMSTVWTGKFYISYGNGDGTFGPPSEYAGLEDASRLSVADMNGDGEPDVIARMVLDPFDTNLPLYDDATHFGVAIFFQRPTASPLPPTVTSSTTHGLTGEPILIPLAGIDASGATLTYHVLSGPTFGSVSLDSTGANLIYTLSSSTAQADGIMVDATSSNGTSNTALLEVIPEAFGRAADADDITVQEGGTHSGSLPSHGPTDVVPTFSISTAPAHGSAQVTNSLTGQYIYQAFGGYNGPDSFQFQVCSPGTCSTNTISVIDGHAQPVVAGSSTINGNCGDIINGTFPGSSPDGDSLTYTILQVTPGGMGFTTLNFASPGTFAFHSTCLSPGTAVLEYEVTNTLTSAIGTVSIVVAPPPVSSLPGSGGGSSGGGTTGGSGSTGNGSGAAKSGGGGGNFGLLLLPILLLCRAMRRSLNWGRD